MDQEEFSAQLQELDRLSNLIDIPLDRSMGSQSNHEQLIEYLVTDSMNLRRYSSRLARIARSFSTQLENLKIKCKNLKTRNDQLLTTIERSTRQLEQSEKSLVDSEERVEYLTGIIEEREKVLNKSVKENEKLRLDINLLQKQLKEKEIIENSQQKSEKLSISVINEDFSKKLAEKNLEITKKTKILEDLMKKVKIFESDLAVERNNNEILRNQNGNLKNDLFVINSKVNDLKTKNFSLKEKIKDLEEKQEDSLKERNELIAKIHEKEEKEKCLEEIETSDHTLDQNFKRNNGRCENLSDFFVSDEIGELDESDYESDNLVFFISTPKMMRDRICSFDKGEGINILSPSFLNKKKFVFDEENFENSEKNVLREGDDNGKNDLLSKSALIYHDYQIAHDVENSGYKEPSKMYFLKLVNEIKGNSPFSEQIKKIPTNRLFGDLISRAVPMCFWPDEIRKYLHVKLTPLI